MTEKPLDYAAAGVDTAAGDRAVELMKTAVSRTHDATVFGATGGFAGMVDASALLGMKRPLLATSTDGVGTKIALAQAMDIHDTIGQDLVGMVVDDIVVVGARPVLMTDYIACGKVVPERIASIVTGIARACEATATPLVGGETAEHPGIMAEDDYDIAGAATGVVDADRLLGAARVGEGDVVVGFASSGLHSNGYSLVRRVIDMSGLGLDAHVNEFGRTLGEELLEPTRLYTKLCLDLVDAYGEGDLVVPFDDALTVRAKGQVGDLRGIHAFSHVTGGGLGANLSRVLPRGVVADIDRGSWVVPPVFDWVRREGGVTWEGLEDSLNLGIGMVAVVGADSVDEVIRFSLDQGIAACVLGEIHTLGTDEKVILGAGQRLISGTKGVDAGAVQLRGQYRLS